MFDEYHDGLCEILVNASNSIDNYFVDKNSTLSSKTSAEFRTSLAKESYLDLEKDIRFRLRLDLPKIEKNLRLVFEDDTSDNLLYDGTTLKEQKLDSKEYYLSLDYLNYVKDALNMRVGAGVKIRRENFVPYLNIRSRYEFYNENNNKSELFNRFRYYSDGEIENNFEVNSLYTLQDDLYAIWSNNLYHTNTASYETLANGITLVSVLKDKQHIQYGVGISSNIEKFESFKVDYYYLNSLFHHVFYKDLVYYEVSPSLLQRDSNNFKTSYRLLITLGVYFNKK